MPALLLILFAILALAVTALTVYLLRTGALQTLVAMSAKLACSGHHISGYSPERIRRDLCTYSPLFKLVTIEQNAGVTSASLTSLATAQVRHHPLLGCSPLNPPRYAPQPPDILEPVEAGTSTKTVRRSHNVFHAPLQVLLQNQVEQDLKAGLDTRALVVVQGEEVIGEAYGAGISGQTRLLGWSMTKSLLAMLYGRMEMLGIADPSTSDLFPEWCNDSRSEITVQNLLQMCDGLAFDETYRPGSDATRMLFGGLPPSRYALQRPLIHTPGRHFSYSSGSTNLLARWMHRQLGGTEATLAFWQQEFLQPLGLPDIMMEIDDDGVFVGSSYGYATAQDWARLGSLFLTGGGVSGKRSSTTVLDETWLARATQPNESNNDPRYGYQLWLNYGGALAPPYPGLPADSFFMLGNREQKLMVAPSHNAVIVRLGWSSAAYPIENRFGEILDVLAR